MSLNSNKKANSRRGIFIGGTLVIVILALYLTFFYPWPAQNTNVSGTIGGVEKVKKYQKEQITSNDVAVQEGEIQQLLQNDKIQKLINDPDFRTAVDNETFRNEFDRNPAFRNAFRTVEYRTVARNVKFTEALRNDDFRNIVAKDGRIITDGKLIEALKNTALRTDLAGPNYLAAIKRNESLRYLADDGQFLAAMRNVEFKQLITSGNMVALLSDGQFVSAFRTDACRIVYRNAAFQMALREASFRNAVGGGFTEALRYDALSKALNRSETFRREVFRNDVRRNIEGGRNADAQRISK